MMIITVDRAYLMILLTEKSSKCFEVANLLSHYTYLTPLHLPLFLFLSLSALLCHMSTLLVKLLVA